MSAFRKLPINDLIKTSEETVALMWRAYEMHLKSDPSRAGWQARSQELHQRCMKFEERLRILKRLRAGGSAPPAEGES